MNRMLWPSRSSDVSPNEHLWQRLRVIVEDQTHVQTMFDVLLELMQEPYCMYKSLQKLRVINNFNFLHFFSLNGHIQNHFQLSLQLKDWKLVQISAMLDLLWIS